MRVATTAKGAVFVEFINVTGANDQQPAMFSIAEIVWIEQAGARTRLNMSNGDHVIVDATYESVIAAITSAGAPPP